MGLLKFYTALAAMMLSGAVAFAGGGSQRKIARLESTVSALASEIDRLAVEMNRIIYCGYVEMQQNRNKRIDLAKLEGFDMRRLCDTVPELQQLYNESEVLRKARREILERDPEIESLREKSALADRTGDRQLQKEVDADYDRLFKRVREEHPDYAEANRLYNHSRDELSYAVTLYLLDHYNYGLGVPMPLTDIIGRSDLALLQKDQELTLLNARSNILRNLRRETMETIERLRFGVDTKRISQGSFVPGL